MAVTAGFLAVLCRGAGVSPAYLPMQNFENISPSKSSGVNSPVTPLSAFCACRRSSASDVEAFRHENQLAVPYFFSDATVLKTIIRSNPGLTLWVNGTVKGMWHHNDTPNADEVIALTKN
jgi:hypothetical protein